MSYLLDTNILTAILKKNEQITNKLEEVDFIGQEVFISRIAYYESKRGLIYANATRQLSELNEVCTNYKILFLDNLEIFERACEIHLDLKRRGNRLEDADILIAATAIAHGLILVSHDSDMQRVPGISLEDWLQTES
ncbi:twitching motility protein PilT [Scytonema hofmannii PCC 7110]|uniref:Ribonuclease VapC n=1 Tax=Scytonema hofmannii PCC 7110 TaxID=128403 RepID=A0A139XFM2_9CYAN|nr:PIN domain-containing protein [Scytonema hofmannii]KYC43494.1 twitching motility protein PilT [Scytonema hofmannii PCC 7110]